MTIRLKNKIVDDSKGMSARASKETINKSVAKISDDTILRLIKKTIVFDRNIHFKEVAKELFRNGIWGKYENDIVNDVSRKVKTKDEVKKKDDRRF